MYALIVPETLPQEERKKNYDWRHGNLISVLFVVMKKK